MLTLKQQLKIWSSEYKLFGHYLGSNYDRGPEHLSPDEEYSRHKEVRITKGKVIGRVALDLENKVILFKDE